MTPAQWKALMQILLVQTTQDPSRWKETDVPGRWVLSRPSGSVIIRTQGSGDGLVGIARFGSPVSAEVLDADGTVSYTLQDNAATTTLSSLASHPDLTEARNALRKVAHQLDSYGAARAAFVDDLIHEIGDE